METTLLWRFHSLGDVVLSTGVAAALGTQTDLWVATETRYRAAYAGLFPEERLLRREAVESSSFAPRFARAVDLQGTLGARRLAVRLGRVARSLRPRSAERRWVVFWGDRFPRPSIPHAVARYAEAAGLDPSDAAERCAPRAVVTPAEEQAARELAPAAFARDAAPVAALIAGASRRTKRYPEASFRAVAEMLAAEGIRVWWIAPPRDDGRDGEDRAIQSAPCFRLPLGPLKAVLARASVVVSCDSGPMHLAAALGTPVIGLFGATVPSFGFAPVGAHAGIVQVENLACRPCGVHGRDRCWLGHWRCLRELTPERVVAEMRRRLAESSEPTDGTRSRHERTATT